MKALAGLVVPGLILLFVALALGWPAQMANAIKRRLSPSVPCRVWGALVALFGATILYAIAFASSENCKAGANGKIAGRQVDFDFVLDTLSENWAYCLATVFTLLAIWLFYIGCPRREAFSPRLSEGMRFEKKQDILLLHHAYRILGVVLFFGFAVVATAAHGFLPDNPAKATSNLVRFFAMGLAATFVVWAARQFERHLQQGRFERAIEMIAKSLECHARNEENMRKAGIALLDDLPKIFLFDKREEISSVLRALGIYLSDIRQAGLPKGSILESEMRAMQLPENRFLLLPFTPATSPPPSP